MTKDDMEIVSAVRTALVGKVGTEFYELWFGRVTLRLAVGGLEVVAPDPFTLERLRHKLRGEIAEACATVLGPAATLSFCQVEAEEPASNAPVELDAETASREGKPMPSSLRAPLRPPAAPPRPPHHVADAVAFDDLPRRKFLTFAQFITGDGNRIALAAAKSAVARLGVASPLLIYGPHGCGKTHLLEGVLSDARRDRRIRRSILVSAEQFTTQFLEALQGSGLPSFRRKYRDLDLLVVDDIQFLSGKKATLIEFQHTLDGLQRSGRQIVLAADRGPNELGSLGSEVVARLTGGLVCGLEPVDEAIRRGILRQAALRLDLKLTGGIIDYLADSLSGDARQLQGAIHRLDATERATGEPLTLASAQRAVVDLVHGGQGLVRLPDIERAVCQVFGLETRLLQSDSKLRSVSQPRMLAMWLARKYTRAGLSEIGEYFGRRSHTTVIAAQRKMDEMLTQRATVKLHVGDCSIQDALRRVEGRLRTG